jgi:hypothetical protein
LSCLLTPGGVNGHRPGAASGDDLARIRRIMAALLCKAAATSLRHEAAACRDKAEALRAKYGLEQMNESSRPGPASLGPGR